MERAIVEDHLLQVEEGIAEPSRPNSRLVRGGELAVLALRLGPDPRSLSEPGARRLESADAEPELPSGGKRARCLSDPS